VALTPYFKAAGPNHACRNIWAPTAQIGLVRTVGEHYGFSSRLQDLMVSPSQPSVPATIATDRISTSGKHPPHDDVEQNLPGAEARSRTQQDDDLAVYRLVKETFNYTSIDFSDRCKSRVTALCPLSRCGRNHV
jgi:hypothetical protein